MWQWDYNKNDVDLKPLLFMESSSSQFLTSSAKVNSVIHPKYGVFSIVAYIVLDVGQPDMATFGSVQWRAALHLTQRADSSSTSFKARDTQVSRVKRTVGCRR